MKKVLLVAALSVIPAVAFAGFHHRHAALVTVPVTAVETVVQEAPVTTVTAEACVPGPLAVFAAEVKANRAERRLQRVEKFNAAKEAKAAAEAAILESAPVRVKQVTPPRVLLKDGCRK